MQSKDIIYAIGIAVTLIIGIGNIIYNFYISRKTIYINSITSERVKWIEKLRDNMSVFISEANYWLSSDVKIIEEGKKIFKNIQRLGLVIKLQLNPYDNYDQKISECVDNIISTLPNRKKEEIFIIMEDIVLNTRMLLKQEWSKVKNEAMGKIKK